MREHSIHHVGPELIFSHLAELLRLQQALASSYRPVKGSAKQTSRYFGQLFFGELAIIRLSHDEIVIDGISC